MLCIRYDKQHGSKCTAANTTDGTFNVSHISHEALVKIAHPDIC